MSIDLSKCTPGPWRVFRDSDVAVGIDAVYGNHSCDDSELMPVRLLSPGKNRGANAALIAAAPDMAQLLEQIDKAYATGRQEEIVWAVRDALGEWKRLKGGGKP